MDLKNLERLRAKYANAKADDVFDPEMKKLNAALFDKPGRRKLPYGGVSTFLDAPYKEDLADLDIALIGVPMDLGVTNRPGARFSLLDLTASAERAAYRRQSPRRTAGAS